MEPDRKSFENFQIQCNRGHARRELEIGYTGFEQLIVALC